MNLRPYQRKATASFGVARREGKRRILLVSPTGSGKTVLLAYLTWLAVAQGKRCLWLVNRRELVAQSVATLERFGLQVGHSGQGLTLPVQVMTYQGALAQGEVPPADVIFADEAHHLAGHGEWITILEAYPDATIVGATATPERGDGRALDFFDALIPVAQSSDLVKVWEQSGGTSGLVPCEVIRPSRPIVDGIARTPVKATLVHKLRDHQQVVFAPHVKAANDFAAEFAGAGIEARVITGAMDPDDRARQLARFRSRDLRVLVNVHVLTEGWDDPGVEVVTLARRFQSIGAMIQATGRGARPAPGKSRFIVLDLCGVTHTLGHPFADREYSLEGDGIKKQGAERIVVRVCKRCSQAMDEGETTCAACGWTRPPPETPQETGDKLERWSFLQADDEGTRVGRLTRWAQAANRGDPRKAMAAAIMRYTAVYGKPPPRVVGHAAANIAGRGWCNTCGHSIRAEGCRCPNGSLDLPTS